MADVTISYAQNFEDVMLWRALRHVTPGFFIDVGAQDPVVDSVSRLFSDVDWRGIHVEPHEQYAQALRDAYPLDTVIQAAVAAQRGTLDYFPIDGTGISTLDPEIARSHKAAGFKVQRMQTLVVTLDEVLDAAQGQAVHWLKIDVEGFEEQVLRGWRESDARPWVAVIESTVPLTQTDAHGQWDALIVAKGYRFVYTDGLNRFYVSDEHPELVPAFAWPPNVFDGFRLSGKSTSSFHREVAAQYEARLDAQEQAHGHRLAVQADELLEARRRIAVAHADRTAVEHIWAEKLTRVQSQLHLVFRKGAEQQADLRQALAQAETLRADQAIDATRTLNWQVADAFAKRQQLQHEHAERIATLEAALALERAEALEATKAHEQAMSAQAQRMAEIVARLEGRESEAIAERQSAISDGKRQTAAVQALLESALLSRQALQSEHIALQQRHAEATAAHAEHNRLEIERHQQQLVRLTSRMQEADDQTQAIRLASKQREQTLLALLDAQETRLREAQARLLTRDMQREAALADARTAATNAEQAARNASSHAHEQFERLHRAHHAALAALTAEIEQQRLAAAGQSQQAANERSAMLLAHEDERQTRAQEHATAIAQLRGDLSQNLTALATELERTRAAEVSLVEEVDSLRHELRRLREHWLVRLVVADPHPRSALASSRAPQDPVQSAVTAAPVPEAPDVAAGAGPAVPRAMHVPAGTTDRPPEEAMNHLTEVPPSAQTLLALDDAAFVAAAYRTVLGRAPDPLGFDDFTAQIRNGVSKESIIVAMHLSPEGQTAKPELDGLAELVAASRQGPRRRLSRALSPLLSESVKPLERQFRVLENRLVRLQRDSQGAQTEARAGSARMEALLARLAGELQTLSSTVERNDLAIAREREAQGALLDGFERHLTSLFDVVKHMDDRLQAQQQDSQRIAAELARLVALSTPAPAPVNPRLLAIDTAQAGLGQQGRSVLGRLRQEVARFESEGT